MYYTLQKILPGSGMGAAASYQLPGIQMWSAFYIYLADVGPLSELCLAQEESSLSVTFILF